MKRIYIVTLGTIFVPFLLAQNKDLNEVINSFQSYITLSLVILIQIIFSIKFARQGGLNGAKFLNIITLTILLFIYVFLSFISYTVFDTKGSWIGI